MADIKTEFTVEFEGETIAVIITEVQEDDSIMVEIEGHDPFEIFLSEEDRWVTNDEISFDEDLIFIIGDQFESLQP